MTLFSELKREIKREKLKRELLSLESRESYERFIDTEEADLIKKEIARLSSGYNAILNSLERKRTLRGYDASAAKRTHSNREIAHIYTGLNETSPRRSLGDH